jgi:hypothetical protein
LNPDISIDAFTGVIRSLLRDLEARPDHTALLLGRILLSEDGASTRVWSSAAESRGRMADLLRDTGFTAAHVEMALAAVRHLRATQQ